MDEGGMNLRREWRSGIKWCGESGEREEEGEMMNGRSE